MRIAPILLATTLILPGCGPKPAGNETDQQVIASASNAYDDTVIDADGRADRLDQQGAELDAAGRRAGGSAGRAMRNEADVDFSDAATVRTLGQQQGENSEDAIEAKAGLINQQ